MKYLKFFVAGLLFFIFFIWSMAGNFNYFYAGYLPNIFFVAFPILFIFSIPGVGEKFKKILPFFEKYSFLIFPLFALLGALYINLFVFYSIPKVQDEINMKFMAEAILNGKLSSPLHPHYEFFRFLYLVPSVNGTYSIYQPGFPLILAVFTFLKIPFLLNPLLTGASVFLLGKITNDFYDRKTASLTMFLASTSIFLISMGGTLMSHSLTAFATLGAFYFCNRAISRKSLKNNIISLLFIVVIMFTRPQNGLFVLSPLIFLVFLKSGFKSALKYSLLCFIFLLPFLAMLYYSDSIFSGELGRPKHVSFFEYSEPENGCMGLGLYKGCRHASWVELPEEGLTPEFAFYVTSLRLFQLVFFLFFHPLMMIFIVLIFVPGCSKSDFKNDLAMLSLFFLTFAAYFFYYFDGNVFGPRYYYEVSFFLVPLAAKGILWVYEKDSTRFSNPLLNVKNLVIIFIATGLLFQYFFSVPILNRIHRAAFWGSDPLLKKTVEEKEITNAVILISQHEYFNSGAAIMNMARIDDNDVIYALDLGDKSNERLMHYYSGRKFYKALFAKEWHQTVPPEIRPVRNVFSVDRLRVRMIDKLYPVDGVPDYCGIYPRRTWIDKYSGFVIPDEIAGHTKFFFCRFTDFSQKYTFGQYIEYGGMYELEIHGAQIPFGGKFKISVEDLHDTIDFYNDTPKLFIHDTEFNLKHGMNFITIEPYSDVAGDGKYFIIDSIVFKKIQ